MENNTQQRFVMMPFGEVEAIAQYLSKMPYAEVKPLMDTLANAQLVDVMPEPKPEQKQNEKT